MPTLSLPKNYADGTILFASDFDAIIDALETFLNVTGIDADNIQDDGITASSIIKDATIPAAKIASNAITTAKIADGAVITSKIPDDNITTAKIVDGSITTAKLNDGAVTTAKIVDNVIGKTKISSNYVFSDSLVTQTIPTSQTSAIAVTNLTCTITCRGNPIEIRLFPIPHPNPNDTTTLYAGGIESYKGSAAAPQRYSVVEVWRDSTVIAKFQDLTEMRIGGTQLAVVARPSIGPVFDDPGAGEYIYTVRAYWTGFMDSTATVISYSKLFVREL